MIPYDSDLFKDFNGAIDIRLDSCVVFRNAYGFADLANQRLNRVDTAFQTASACKFFVAIGIMKMVEAGKLSLEDRIGEILHFDLRAIDPALTIRQLLTHTSGVPDYFDESVMDDYAELWTDFPNYRIRKTSDLLPLFINKPMMYPRGARFQYNNSGYVLLALVLEEMAGVPFDVYLADTLFKPCGMTDTAYWELDRLPANCANAYIFDPERNDYFTNIYSVDAKGSGAGGAFTTVLDIMALWKRLLDGLVLTRETMEAMFSVQATGDGVFYGYGVWLRKTEAGYFIPFFQGSDPGVSFISSYDFIKRRAITLISNMGNDVWSLERKIIKLMDKTE